MLVCVFSFKVRTGMNNPMGSFLILLKYTTFGCRPVWQRKWLIDYGLIITISRFCRKNIALLVMCEAYRFDGPTLNVDGCSNNSQLYYAVLVIDILPCSSWEMEDKADRIFLITVYFLVFSKELQLFGLETHSID